MGLFHRAAAAFAVIALVAGGALLGPLGAGPAHAQTTDDFCENNDGIWCLNDWDGIGYGNTLGMYQAGSSNEDFVLDYLGRCGGDVTVSPDCPFANPVFDSRYQGFPIVQIKYPPIAHSPNGLCVATNTSPITNPSSGEAILGSCNNSDGTGGDAGTVFIYHNGYLISLYWSNQDNWGSNASCMTGAQINGGTINMDLDTVNGCPIWGIYAP